MPSIKHSRSWSSVMTLHITVFQIIPDVYSEYLELCYIPRQYSSSGPLIEIIISLRVGVYQSISVILHYHPLSQLHNGDAGHTWPSLLNCWLHHTNSHTKEELHWYRSTCKCNTFSPHFWTGSVQMMPHLGRYWLTGGNGNKYRVRGSWNICTNLWSRGSSQLTSVCCKQQLFATLI